MNPKYKSVKTGQDLIDLGIIPKTSSENLALISHLRLQSLRETVMTRIDEQALGTWLPLFESNSQDTLPEWLTDAEEIRKYAKAGWTVECTGSQDGRDLTGAQGTIRNERNFNETGYHLGIDFGTQLPRQSGVKESHNLDGGIKTNNGWWVRPDLLKVFVPKNKRVVRSKYQLRNGVVTDETLGHLVRFECDMMFEEGQDKAIPKGTIATICSYDPRDDALLIRTEEPIAGLGNRKNFSIKVRKEYDMFSVSSLGQQPPLELESAVREETLLSFFPKTVIDAERAERKILGLLMSKPMLFYGPPGSGKTNITEDIADIAMQQEVLFTVKGCRVQCNPFSIFDARFAKEVPACPECMMKYCKDFRDTGEFVPPQPKDVEVVAIKYGPGHGIIFKEGNSAMKRHHLVGWKPPRFDGETGEGASMSDPEGFDPGIVILASNGLLVLDEIDKWSRATREALLYCIQEKAVIPEQLKIQYPSQAHIICTANDPSVLEESFNDRVLLTAIRYPKDVSVASRITKAGFHNTFTPAEDIVISDIHTMKPLRLKDTAMSIIIEQAIERFYINFQDEYKGAGKSQISTSNRSKFDALMAARAKLFIDQVFFPTTSPKTVTPDHAVFGIQYALCSRVQEQNHETGRKAKVELCDYVRNSFDDLLKQSAKHWWCEATKYLAIAKAVVPIIEMKWYAEIKSYEEDARNAVSNYDAVKKAEDAPHDKQAQIAKANFPFMSYLFKYQPRFNSAKPEEITELVKHFIMTKEDNPCAPEAGK